jgi:hypothetical protein
MLRILGYVPSQSDEKKFLYSNYRHISDEGYHHELPASKHLIEPSSPLQSDDVHGNEKKFVGEMQEKVLQMNGSSIPRLQNTVLLLKNEL